MGKVAEKEGVLEVAFDIETEGSVTTGDILINDPDLEELWESVFGGVIPKLIDYIYPLGSVIASVNSAFDPNEAYKSQTWVRFAEGRTLVGVDTSDTDFKTVEKTGGEKRRIN